MTLCNKSRMQQLDRFKLVAMRSHDLPRERLSSAVQGVPMRWCSFALHCGRLRGADGVDGRHPQSAVHRPSWLDQHEGVKRLCLQWHR